MSGINGFFAENEQNVWRAKDDHSLLGQAVLLLELQVLLVECVHSVDHGLDELNLGIAQSVLVRDVVGDSSLTAGFSTGSTRLKV